jgi:hypothetical protein
VIRPRITYDGTPFEMKVKGFRAAVKDALQRGVAAWHHGADPAFSGQSQGFLAFHFSRQAMFRYPGVYQPRTLKYERRKEHKYGHRNPLVFSGLSQRAVCTSISVSGTSKSVHGTMTGANQAFNFGGRPGMPKMREELLAVNQQEADALARGIEQILTAFLAGSGYKSYGSQAES